MQVSVHPAELLGRLEHPGRAPTHRHLPVSPPLDIAGMVTADRDHRLHRVGLAARAAAAALMAAAVEPVEVRSWIIWVVMGVAWPRIMVRVDGPWLVRIDAGSLPVGMGARAGPAPHAASFQKSRDAAGFPAASASVAMMTGSCPCRSSACCSVSAVPRGASPL